MLRQGKLQSALIQLCNQYSWNLCEFSCATQHRDWYFEPTIAMKSDTIQTCDVCFCLAPRREPKMAKKAPGWMTNLRVSFDNISGEIKCDCFCHLKLGRSHCTVGTEDISFYQWGMNNGRESFATSTVSWAYFDFKSECYLAVNWNCCKILESSKVHVVRRIIEILRLHQYEAGPHKSHLH